MKYRTFTEIDSSKVDGGGATYAFESEDGYQVYVKPVMFGWRVLLYEPGSSTYLLNICCGVDIDVIAVTHAQVLQLATENQSVVEAANQLGYPDIKPWPNDINYMMKMMTIRNDETFDEYKNPLDFSFIVQKKTEFLTELLG